MDVSNIIVSPEAIVETPFLKEVEALSEEVYSHKALKNPFYDLWTSERLSNAQVEIFAVNYYHRIYSTVQRITMALVTIDDWVSRLELLHNLTDEMGHGDPHMVHVLILKRWIQSLLTANGGGDFDEVLERVKPLPETVKFVNQTFQNCSMNNVLSCGTLLGQEWHAYSQIAHLYDGFLLYKDSYQSEEFHDMSDYFYIHLGMAEKQHKLQTIVMAARNCQTEEEFKTLQQGFYCYLDLVADFWHAIYDNMMKV